MKGNLVKVECPNGHRFQVNLNKHVDRNYRYCPVCKAEVQVKPSILNWKPNTSWPNIKKELEDARKEEKERKRQKRGTPPAFILRGSSV